MGSFRGLEIGFSFVFGGIFLGFVAAELYYVLWWKKRRAAGVGGGEYHVKNFSFLLFWRKPSSFNSSGSSPEPGNAPESVAGAEERHDLEVGSGQDPVLTGYEEEEGVDAELIRLHNLSGPPRFLYTIEEENREDVESEDGKSSGGGTSGKGSGTRSLSDLVSADGTPFFTPMSSPGNRASPIWPDSCYSGRFSPLSEAELNWLRSSPPPAFKFMKDAEDKYVKKLMEEAGSERPVKDSGVKDSWKWVSDNGEGRDGFSVSVIDKRQVLPLALLKVRTV